MIEEMKTHWPEYLIEGAGLGIFMVSACLFGVLLWHPDSPVSVALPDGLMRRALMGAAMGITAVAIIYSPWGKRSGAHINPAVTLVFWRLGKVRGADAVGYIASQFIGAAAGVLAALAMLGYRLEHPSVNYVATLPGEGGVAAAFAGEAVISFIQMSLVLMISNRISIARYTGLIAGLMVGIYIAFESPISGMSMNPARSFGSAFAGRIWQSIWIYFTAPPLGMFLAAGLYLRLKGGGSVLCAKLHHHNNQRCIFRCRFGEAA